MDDARLEQQERTTRKSSPSEPAAATVAPPAAEKPKRERKAKAEPTPETGAEISEQESLAELYKIAANYVQKDAVEANRVARQKTAKEHLAATYKVATIKDLPHPQRLQFIAWLKAGIAANGTPEVVGMGI